jgi:hypothetical protein
VRDVWGGAPLGAPRQPESRCLRSTPGEATSACASHDPDADGRSVPGALRLIRSQRVGYRSGEGSGGPVPDSVPVRLRSPVASADPGGVGSPVGLDRETDKLDETLRIHTGRPTSWYCFAGRELRRACRVFQRPGRVAFPSELRSSRGTPQAFGSERGSSDGTPGARLPGRVLRHHSDS